MSTSSGLSKPCTYTLHGAQHPSEIDVGQLVAKAADAVSRTGQQALAYPFDGVRAQYAYAVRAGLIRRSMLAHRDFERALGAVERLCLGPWARRV